MPERALVRGKDRRIDKNCLGSSSSFCCLIEHFHLSITEGSGNKLVVVGMHLVFGSHVVFRRARFPGQVLT